MTVHPTRRRTTRVAALVGAAALAVATLAGCIKVDATVAINSDAMSTGTLGFAFQKQAATMMGITDLDSFKTQMDSGDMGAEGFESFDDCTTSETDTDFVYTCSFTDQAFTDPTGLWTIAKSGDSIVFHMVSEGQTGTEGSDAAALLGDASLGSINVNVTFPGPISEITGSGAEKTDDTTATITGTMTSSIDVTITSAAGGGGVSISGLLVVLAALAVVALIVIVIVVLLLRRRKPAPLPEASGPPVDAAAAVATATGTVVLGDAGAPDAAAETIAETAVMEATEPPVVETITEPVTEALPDTPVVEPPVVEPPVVEPPVVEPVTEPVTDGQPDDGTPAG